MNDLEYRIYYVNIALRSTKCHRLISHFPQNIRFLTYISVIHLTYLFAGSFFIIDVRNQRKPLRRERKPLRRENLHSFQLNAFGLSVLRHVYSSLGWSGGINVCSGFVLFLMTIIHTMLSPSRKLDFLAC